MDLLSQSSLSIFPMPRARYTPRFNELYRLFDISTLNLDGQVYSACENYENMDHFRQVLGIRCY